MNDNFKYKFAVDLTWLRHNYVGGTEYYARNLVSGFAKQCSKKNFEMYLITASDNYELFEEFQNYENIRIIKSNICSMNRFKRVLWQNFRLTRVLRKLDVSICVEPVFLKPFISSRKVKFITTIHDLQAAHYPEYFNPVRVAFMKMAWKNSISTSCKIVVTSEYVKKDISQRYKVPNDKIFIAYDPVTIDINEVADQSFLNKFGVQPHEYYYVAASLLPHKNIETVITAMGELKAKNSCAFSKLLISGTGGKSKKNMESLIEKYALREEVIFTPYLSIPERNLLYRDCRAYFAPSLFEGFGMTPIEAMIMGAPVITTKETCSYEITGGIVNYVNDAKNALEWCELLENGLKKPKSSEVENLVKNYSKENVADVFLEKIEQIIREK